MADTPTTRRRILFVDDDVAFLDMIGKVFNVWGGDKWQIITAPNTGKAIGILQEQPVDLAVIDIHMPGVDGFQFLRLLQRRYPNLTKAVLTGDPSEELQRNCLSCGAELYLVKPTSIEGLQSIFATLDELAKGAGDEGFRGVMRRISLQELLQLECLNKNSSILEVAAGPERGQIFIQDGLIIHAQVGHRKGEPAFNYLLTFRGGEFSHKPFIDPPERSIDVPWEHLIMEALRLRDEAAESPAATAQPETAPASGSFLPAPAQPPAKMPDILPVDGIIGTPVQPALEASAIDQAPPGFAALQAARTLVAPRIEEMVVVSPQGRVLYEWQCPALENRLKLLEFLTRRTSELHSNLPLGAFERLELPGDNARMVMLMQGGNRMLVRSGKGEPAK